MTIIRNRFTDPRTGTFYDWPINHADESPMVKSRAISDGAPTSSVGLIPQQGAPVPLKLEWKGTIFTLAQLQAFLQWWNLCESQSIWLTDLAGSQYEILITDFQPQRVAVARNFRDPDNAPRWIWTYTLNMRVLKPISGEWMGVK